MLTFCPSPAQGGSEWDGAKPAAEGLRNDDANGAKTMESV